MKRALMTRAVLVLAMSLALAGRAEAGGTFVPDIGTVGLGRAGAMVASGDDGSALVYNPANLVPQDKAPGMGLRLQLDVQVVWRHVEFARSPDALSTDGYSTVRNQAGPVPVPMVIAAYTPQRLPLAFAFGVWAPNNASLVFDDNGPQRYSITRTASFIFHAHLAVAYQPFRWLSLGAGFMWTAMVVNQAQMVNVGLFGQQERAGDVLMELSGAQPFLPNANFGITLRPGAGFSIGASFIPPRLATPRGTFKITPSEALASLLSVSGESMRVEQTLPAIARAGVAWQWGKRLTVEANYVFEGWSAYGRIRIIPDNVSYSLLGGAPTALGELQLVRDFRDSHSLRLGIDALLFEPLGLRLRAGYYYEPGVVPLETVNVGSNDIRKHGLTVGASLSVWKLTASVAYARALYAPLVVTASQHSVLNPINAADTSVVGNGRYQFGYDSFGMSLAFQL